MQYSDDPVSDYAAWDAKQARWLEKRPVCSECDEHIADDVAYYIEGEWVCERCMDSYKREVLPE